MQVKYCYQCPFNDLNDEHCQLAMRDFEMGESGGIPPFWCPLLKGPIMVEYNPQMYLDL